MGMPCDLGRILPIARVHGLKVIEDAACAIGSEIHVDGAWVRIGAPLGDVACFSFHPRKVLTTGEGGMLTTRHPEWDRLFRLWRQHGMSIPDTVRHNSARVLFENYLMTGFNYRMTDMQAAIGRQQLQRLAEIIERRRTLAASYNEMLSSLEQVQPPAEPEWCRSNWQGYCVRLAPSLDQTAIMQSMLDEGIATRRGIMCAHLEPAYANHELRFPLPESERARNESILLPLYPQMTNAMQEQVVTALAYAAEKSR